METNKSLTHFNKRNSWKFGSKLSINWNHIAIPVRIAAVSSVPAPSDNFTTIGHDSMPFRQVQLIFVTVSITECVGEMIKVENKKPSYLKYKRGIR
jgi:hypothetical protein